MLTIDKIKEYVRLDQMLNLQDDEKQIVLEALDLAKVRYKIYKVYEDSEGRTQDLYDRMGIQHAHQTLELAVAAVHADDLHDNYFDIIIIDAMDDSHVWTTKDLKQAKRPTYARLSDVLEAELFEPEHFKLLKRFEAEALLIANSNRDQEGRKLWLSKLVNVKTQYEKLRPSLPE